MKKERTKEIADYWEIHYQLNDEYDAFSEAILEALAEEHVDLKDETKRLREALEFYADEKVYTETEHHCGFDGNGSFDTLIIDMDRGKKAIAALQAAEVKCG